MLKKAKNKLIIAKKIAIMVFFYKEWGNSVLLSGAKVYPKPNSNFFGVTPNFFLNASMK